MKVNNRSLGDKIIILFLIYPIAVFLAILFIVFRAFGKIKVLKQEHIPHRKGNLIILSNHPSLVEPILLPVMFYKNYLLHPLKLIPYSTPDKKNYYDRWYWRWLLKHVTIPIDRSNPQERSTAFRAMVKILKSDGTIIVFGEGGRTKKGTHFFYSPLKRKRIRPLQEGVASLIRKTGASVLPVWVDHEEKSLKVPDKVYFSSLIFVFFLELLRNDSKTTIKVGETLSFKKSDCREEITQRLITKLLGLADE
jgi:1-acyl-sn-glycerol-3-phosphate acyltransferase